MITRKNRNAKYSSKNIKTWNFTWSYSGISIKRTHYKADTSIRRTVWRGTDCFALRSNYVRKNLYKADISIKRTLFYTNGVRFKEIPLYNPVHELKARIFRLGQRRIQSLVDYLRWRFLQITAALNCFCKHLYFRFSTGLWIWLWSGLNFIVQNFHGFII